MTTEAALVPKHLGRPQELALRQQRNLKALFLLLLLLLLLPLLLLLQASHHRYGEPALAALQSQSSHLL